MLDHLRQDVRYAVRAFRRNPVLSGAVILTLAFGIGLNSGVFSVISGMVFRARVAHDPASFFQLLPESPDGARLFGNSVADLAAYRTRVPHAVDVAGWAVAGARVEDDARITLAMSVSCDFFRLYGLERAKLGRLFDSGDCGDPGKSPVAIISEELWHSRFYSDPALVGGAIRMNGRPFTIIGIAPARFSGRLRGPGIWTPFTMQGLFHDGIDLFRESGRPWLTVEGRLAPGATRDEVRAELEAAGGRKVVLTNGSLIQMPEVRTMALWVSPLVMTALTLILLLACTNVTMLMLSRAAARRYEMGVRLALGASRGRLLRMAATEGILLAILGGGIAAFVAGWVPALLEMSIPQMPHYPMQPDWVVFSYLVGITLLAGCMAGLMPAAESFRSDLTGSLKHQESGVKRLRWRLRDLLIAAQVAMSMVLLVGAALFVRTEYRLFHADPGFDARHVLLISLPPIPMKTIDPAVRALSGVRSVAYAASLPYGRPQEVTIRVGGGPPEPAVVSEVSPGFFATLGIPMVAGRDFVQGERGSVVVPESFAHRYWNGSAIGHEFETSGGVRWRVDGVVRDTDLERHGTGAGPRFYALAEGAMAPRVLLVRFEGDSASVASELRGVFHQLSLTERELPRTMDAEIAEMGSRFRSVVGMALFLGASAFVLAVIGVYSVIAFAVSRRRKEMGIRIALGATQSQIVQAVLSSGARPVLAGVAFGLPLAAMAAWALARAFRNTPVSIAAWDLPAYGWVAILLAGSAAVAMLKPALQASIADPAAVLKED